MNAKRWFAWVCLALMLVAEGLLFHANHQRDDALAQLSKTQQELRAVMAERDTLTNSSAGQQAALITFLKNQNETLTARANALQKNVEQLQAQSQQTAEHLSTARSALQLQQEHMQQLQAQQQQALAVANATACVNNLRMIDAAKTQWGLEKQKSSTDVPTVQDLQPYLKDGVFPSCPDGGTYSINAEGELPSCSIPGHVLPPQ
jgi:ABC-type transporter Mla subunit MlaD